MNNAQVINGLVSNARRTVLQGIKTLAFVDVGDDPETPLERLAAIQMFITTLEDLERLETEFHAGERSASDTVAAMQATLDQRLTSENQKLAQQYAELDELRELRRQLLEDNE